MAQYAKPAVTRHGDVKTLTLGSGFGFTETGFEQKTSGGTSDPGSN